MQHTTDCLFQCRWHNLQVRQCRKEAILAVTAAEIPVVVKIFVEEKILAEAAVTENAVSTATEVIIKVDGNNFLTLQKRQMMKIICLFCFNSQLSSLNYFIYNTPQI
jgi:hypothetical protein